VPSQILLFPDSSTTDGSEAFPQIHRLDPKENTGVSTALPYVLMTFSQNLLKSSMVLIKAVPESHDEIALAFVNDTYLAARAPSLEEAYEKLEYMMTRPQGALE
jgi:hypothetical protein